MDAEDRIWDTKVEASAGPSQLEELDHPTQQMSALATFNHYSQPLTEKPSTELHLDQAARSAGCEALAKPWTPPRHETPVIHSVGAADEDDLEAQFDADLEAEFEAFDDWKEDDEVEAYISEAHKDDEDAVKQQGNPEEAQEGFFTPEADVFYSRIKPPSLELVELVDCSTPSRSKDSFGENSDGELGSQTSRDWVEDDKFRDARKRSLTPSRSEREVTKPEAPDREPNDDRWSVTPPIRMISVADVTNSTGTSQTASEAAFNTVDRYVAAEKTTTQPEIPSPTPASGILSSNQREGSSPGDSSSLPDYESEADDIEATAGITPAPIVVGQSPDIIVAEPTPRHLPEQSEASNSDSGSTSSKRRRSDASAGKQQPGKRIRIVLKRTPSPQPPRGGTEDVASADASARAHNKHRRSSDPGPRPISKRPRIVLKQRTPQPAPAPALLSTPPPHHPFRRYSQAWLDGQISPKTVAPAPAAPDEDVLPPENRGARKARPLPPDKPSTSNITWASLESLLPCSALGQAHWVHRRYWTVKEEIELRSAWTADDEASFAISHSEVLVGRFVQQLYGCQIQDLFRYGLNYISPPRGHNGNPTDDALWLTLMRLLPHPFFLGRVDILRYALQGAIVYRTSEANAGSIHVNAFMPPWSHKEPGYITWLKESRSQYPEGSSGYHTHTLNILQTSEWRCRSQISSKIGMQDLFGIMNHQAPSYNARYPPHDVDPLEHYLFILTQRDLTFLETCLNKLDARQRMRQETKAKTWQEKHGVDEPDPESNYSEDDFPEDDDNKTGTNPVQEQQHVAPNTGMAFNLEPAPPPPSQLPPPPLPPKNVPLKPITVNSSFLHFWISQPADRKLVTLEAKALYTAEKRLGILARRREALIRQKISARGGRGEVRVLPDVPPFDPDPDCHLFREASGGRWFWGGDGERGSQEAVMVVQGWYTTREMGRWLAWWDGRRRAREQLEEEALGRKGRRRNPRRGTRERVDSAVERVLGVAVGSGEVDDGRVVTAVVDGGAVSGSGYRGREQSKLIPFGPHRAGDRGSIVSQVAVCRKRDKPPPIVSIAGRLWARRRGIKQ
jgi:hypothetical protein